MKSKKTDMQLIFSKLSEKNKDILILVAKSMKIAQETSEPPCERTKDEAVVKCH